MQNVRPSLDLGAAPNGEKPPPTISIGWRSALPILISDPLVLAGDHGLSSSWRLFAVDSNPEAMTPYGQAASAMRAGPELSDANDLAPPGPAWTPKLLDWRSGEAPAGPHLAAAGSLNFHAAALAIQLGLGPRLAPLARCWTVGHGRRP